MKLIVMTGLPATGKSSIAEALGRELSIPVFALDWLRGVMRRHELEAEKAGYAAYEMLVTLARRQLMLGQYFSSAFNHLFSRLESRFIFAHENHGRGA